MSSPPEYKYVIGLLLKMCRLTFSQGRSAAGWSEGWTLTCAVSRRSAFYTSKRSSVPQGCWCIPRAERRLPKSTAQTNDAGSPLHGYPGREPVLPYGKPVQRQLRFSDAPALCTSGCKIIILPLSVQRAPPARNALFSARNASAAVEKPPPLVIEYKL